MNHKFDSNCESCLGILQNSIITLLYECPFKVGYLEHPSARTCQDGLKHCQVVTRLIICNHVITYITINSTVPLDYYISYYLNSLSNPLSSFLFETISQK